MRVGRSVTAVLVTTLAFAGPLVIPPTAAASAAPGWAPEAAAYGVSATVNLPITMADGTVLRADVYSPTDPATGKPASGPFPVIVGETPYGKELAQAGTPVSLAANYDPYYVQRGYIMAVVDVRGTGASGGQWNILEPQEAADSVRVIDWAATLPNSTGAVGMFGDSYGGIDQLFAAAAIGPDSPLKAIFPIMTANDVYRELATEGGMVNAESDPLYLGGVTALNLADPALDDPTGAITPITQHLIATANNAVPLTLGMLTGGDQAYDGDYWQARDPVNVLRRVVDNGVPAYLVGGEYDVFQAGEPPDLSGLQNATAGRPVTAAMAPGQPVSGRYQLLVGPYYHTNYDNSVVEPTALAWYDRWLKNEPTGIDNTADPLHIIDPRGRRFDLPGYPAPQAIPTTYYLGDNGTLNTAPPATGHGADTIPFTGAALPCDRETEQFLTGLGVFALGFFGLTDPCANTDPLPGTSTPLRLTYTTPPLASQETLAGPIDASIYATANTTDTEWVAQLDDVAPDGTATELTGGSLLGSLRATDPTRTWTTSDGRILLPYHPFTRASTQPVTPGAVTRYDIQIRPMFATLAAGHRLRLTIATSDLPRLLPRADQLLNLLGGSYQVQRNANAASSLTVPLIGG
ncbi:MAG TPA: CocE/NonD family hydrolase [Pseudonocardiaceae bacterium]|nr:CocE/NonD family hydrolase [Pseudonocardiaceae bacterium]